jgi:prepilin-type N-terminal cleavage/methylation domain-containing protein
MKTFQIEPSFLRNSQIRRMAGFTLIEFMIAMALFLIIGSATFAMFAKNAPYFTQQQSTAALNIGLQNVVSQMQLDLVNAGTGYYPGMLLPSWPTGVTIINSVPTSACNVAATYTYTSTCFDKLNILAINPNTPPTHPTDSTGLTGTSNCSSVGALTAGATPAQDTALTFYIQPAVVSGVTQTPTQTAAGYSKGDQIILIQSIAGSGNVNGVTTGGASTVGTNGATINTFVLTGSPVINANTVGLPFKAAGNGTPLSVNSSADDPLDISTSSTASNLGTTFCPADWVMKLDPITYQVSTANAADPTLTRTHTVSGTVNVDNIAEQIIGFKVGASVWGLSDNGITTSTTLYNFYAQNTTTATQVGYNNNFSLVRSIRVSLIGRTTPNPTQVFQNTFDGGPYQVLGTDVVINPRNMTMN